MITNKNKIKKFILQYNQHQFELDSNKILIGSAPFCHVRINSKSISHLHAILYIEDKITIQDLRSLNGTFVNGVRIESQQIEEGVTLQFGDQHLQLIENGLSNEFKNEDSNIEKIEEIPLFDLFNDSLENFKFQDNLILQTSLDFLKLEQFDKENYIEITDHNFEDPTELNSQEICAQIITLTNGIVLDINHVPFSNNSISLNKNRNGYVSELIPFKMDQFINFNSSEIKINSIEGFNIHLFSEDNAFKEIKSNEVVINSKQAISLSNNNIQIIVRFVALPPTLKKMPFFMLEKSFQKDLAKVLGFVFAPMLLLLLLDTTPPKEEIEVAVVYKRKAPIESPHIEMMSEQTDKKVVGNQADQMEKPDQAKPAESQQQEVAEQAEPTPAAKTPERKIASIKTFKLNAPTNLNSIFESSNSPSEIVQDSTTAKLNNLDMGKTASNTKNLRGDLKISKVGNGQGLTNYGLAGLSNRKGHQAAHIETETVVMGSMDPELLRKILQEYIPQFRHCYQQELSVNSEKVKGVIDLNFRINGNGSVSQINVAGKGAKFSNNGTNCVSSVLKLINFPKPKGGGVVDVKQPLNFFSDQERI